jgi:hypothetical protein
MNELRVSDHALLRYLERGRGIDVEAVRRELVASCDASHRAATAMGGGNHLILADRLIYVVRQGVMTTVMHECSRYRHARILGMAPEQ